ncbi:MAG: hypothetical protein LBR83_01360 [Clostridiales bacterium]|jgi:chitinase|nr:hypothetical protein [Clostridiales bacterium]
MFKKVIKKISAIILSAALLAGMFAPVYAAEEATEAPPAGWADFNLLDGFTPADGGTMTFGEFATAFGRAMGYTERYGNFYFDVPAGHPHEDGIVKLSAMSLIQDAGYVKPDEPMPRMKFFEVVVKAFGLPLLNGNTAFADDESIPAASKLYVKSLESAGILSGETADIDGALTYDLFFATLDGYLGLPIYEPGEYTRNERGNLIINAPDVSLVNSTVEGNLYVSAGGGAVDLSGVSVAGAISVRGATDVTLANVSANALVLESTGANVTVSGDSFFESIEVRKDMAISGAAEAGKDVANRLVIDQLRHRIALSLENVNIYTLDNNNWSTTLSGTANFAESVGTLLPGKEDTVVIAGRPRNSDKKLNVYFINWAMYSDLHRSQTVGDLPWDRISTINHAFWRIVPNEAHTEFPIASTDAEADVIHFAAYEEYTARYPEVNVVLSVGGWTDTKWFAEMASTDSGRQSFIDSCVDTLNQYPFLGGVDIDWEYPGTQRNGEGEGYIGSEADRNNFTALMKGMREAFDAAGHADKIITYCASTSVSAHEEGSIAIDHAAVAPYVDRINIMTYDMAGSWSGRGLHHSGLYPGEFMEGAGVSASESAEYFISLGVDPGKINIGSPLYSQGWSIPSAVTEGTDAEIAAGALGQPASKDGYGSIGTGQMYWFDLKAMENTPGWIAGYDEVSQAAYLYNNDSASSLYQQFYSYENERSLEAKLDFINEKGLGGLIVWDTPGDSANHAMLSRMAKGLGIWDGAIPAYDPEPYSAPEYAQANDVGFWYDDYVWSAGDAAIYEGNVYICVADTHVGGEEFPGSGYGYWTNGDSWNIENPYGTEAELLTIPEVTIPEWNDETVWNIGAIVRYNGNVYVCLATTHIAGGEHPETTWGYWAAYDPAAGGASEADAA